MRGLDIRHRHSGALIRPGIPDGFGCIYCGGNGGQAQPLIRTFAQIFLFHKVQAAAIGGGVAGCQHIRAIVRALSQFGALVRAGVPAIKFHGGGLDSGAEHLPICGQRCIGHIASRHDAAIVKVDYPLRWQQGKLLGLSGGQVKAACRRCIWLQPHVYLPIQSSTITVYKPIAVVDPFHLGAGFACGRINSIDARGSIRFFPSGPPEYFDFVWGEACHNTVRMFQPEFHIGFVVFIPCHAAHIPRDMANITGVVSCDNVVTIISREIGRAGIGIMGTAGHFTEYGLCCGGVVSFEQKGITRFLAEAVIGVTCVEGV